VLLEAQTGPPAAARGEVGEGPNRLRGKVLRSAYLGEARDYQVELEGGGRLRVTAPPASDLAVGTPVTVFLPVEHCRVVTR
jgi:hypothetical protein